MNAFRIIVVCLTSLAPVWGIYPGYFGYNAYSAVPAPFFPNIVPQTQPLFAYSFMTPHGADSVAAINPAVAAKSIYTAPGDTFRGYSIQTEYEGGGKSEVVFVTGPQANQILQKSVDFFRQIVPPELDQLTGVNATNTTTSVSVKAAAPAPPPIASMYHVQLYPADTSPFFGPVTPFQNLVSSFAYSITNDIKDAAKEGGENAGEAQESMIHEIGAAVTASPENSTTQTPAEASSTTAATETTTGATETTTAASSTTSAAPPVTTPESTTTGSTPSEETNDIAESNTTTAAADEIMETTNS